MSYSDDDAVTIWDCPKCPTGKLVHRVNRKEGTRFLGCTNYPECKYTQPEEPTEGDE
jgi:DNA topoisomerase III